MAEKSLSLHRRRFASRDMRITNDIVERANARTMARSDRPTSYFVGPSVNSDGSFEVSVMYRGKRYSQHITQEQLKTSFGKAISSHVKKI